MDAVVKACETADIRGEVVSAIVESITAARKSAAAVAEVPWKDNLPGTFSVQIELARHGIMSYKQYIPYTGLHLVIVLDD